ncbi:C-type lectin domain family 7 member A [Chelydra serpentina]|uniref:C-type lectin domain family 7 member A n=1 Tax=Chelydra serpentina TaxID=8475 RepID=A0A8T1S0M2_CHESE|nr:C-type lectin domain family 7 member A [Chelydra serpentina]
MTLSCPLRWCQPNSLRSGVGKHLTTEDEIRLPSLETFATVIKDKAVLQGDLDCKISWAPSNKMGRDHSPLFSTEVPLGPHHWRLVTLILGVCSLVLLIVLLGLIGKYLHFSEATRRKMAMLQRQTQKLKDLVKKQAGGKGSKCDSCLDTWVQHGDACYLFSNLSAKWPECVEHCKKQDAKLVKMDSQGELAFLKRETRKLFRVEFWYRRHYSYWIGLTYKASLKKWVWLDGSAFALDLSSVGAQVLYDGNDACVFFIQGMSHAKDCAIKHYCLCKKNK